jgi:hypothetical protein
MTKKEVTQKIFENISSQIERFNFKPDLKNQWFVCKTSDTVCIYDIHFYEQTNIKNGIKGFLIEPYVWINVKAIEELYKEITVNKELKKDTDFKTLGTRIAELIANPDGIHKKWNQSLNLFVYEEAHIKEVAKKLTEQFEKIALPYCTDNGNIKLVDYLLNKNPKEYCVHMSNDLFRFIKGLIAAKLNNNPKIGQLSKIYEDLIIERDMPDNCKEEMNRLKAILPMIGNKMAV